MHFGRETNDGPDLLGPAFCGGWRGAIIYTLIATARQNGLDPEAWLAGLARRVADHPASRIDELLPWSWRNAAEQRRAA